MSCFVARGVQYHSMRILHRVSLIDAAAHLVAVETTIGDDAPLPDALDLFFAVWTPGSYLVREYSRHVESMVCEGHEVTKTRKNAWIVKTGGAREITVRYRVYCGELTVRTNHVDTTHLYLNGASTFVCPKDHLDASRSSAQAGTPIEVELDVPEGWRVATPLLKPVSARRFRAKKVPTRSSTRRSKQDFFPRSDDARRIAPSHVLPCGPNAR